MNCIPLYGKENVKMTEHEKRALDFVKVVNTLFVIGRRMNVTMSDVMVETFFFFLSHLSEQAL